VAIFFDLVVYIEKNVFGGGLAAEIIAGAIVKQKKAQRVVVQAGDALDKGGRAAEINIEILFFPVEAFAQASLFLLLF
jgi:hypothetical protein